MFLVYIFACSIKNTGQLILKTLNQKLGVDARGGEELFSVVVGGPIKPPSDSGFKGTSKYVFICSFLSTVNVGKGGGK